MQDPAQDPKPLQIPENKPVGVTSNPAGGVGASNLAVTPSDDSSAVSTASAIDQSLQEENAVGAADLSAAAGAVDQLLASADAGVDAPAVSAVADTETPSEPPEKFQWKLLLSLLQLKQSNQSRQLNYQLNLLLHQLKLSRLQTPLCFQHPQKKQKQRKQ